MDEAVHALPLPAWSPAPALFAATGLTVLLGSGYELLFGCRACQETATGMPAPFSTGLSILGLAFGAALCAAAAPRRPLTPARLRACEALVLAGVTLGAALLLGVVSGVYRFCPICVGVWSAVGLSCLAVVGLGGREGRRMTLALGAFLLAAAWTRFDRTTAQGLAAFLPHAELSGACVAEVLTPDDLRALRRLGVPEGVPTIFVAHCSPCASASVGRILAKSPSTPVVAADATLARLVGPARLVVYPPLAVRAAKLGANLYQATLRNGELQACKSNVTRVQ